MIGVGTESEDWQRGKEYEAGRSLNRARGNAPTKQVRPHFMLFMANFTSRDLGRRGNYSALSAMLSFQPRVFDTKRT
jgi:hypothetical protein